MNKEFTSYDAAVNAAFETGVTTILKNNGGFASNTIIEPMGTDDNGHRLVSVNVHLSEPIKHVLGSSYDSFKDIIEEYNTCYDGEEAEVVAKWGSYDYFFEFIPSATMADLLGTIESKYKPEPEQPMEKMLHTALMSGCAVMDMTDMSIHSL